jgi:hypothetical protein
LKVSAALNDTGAEFKRTSGTQGSKTVYFDHANSQYGTRTRALSSSGLTMLFFSVELQMLSLSFHTAPCPRFSAFAAAKGEGGGLIGLHLAKYSSLTAALLSAA